MEPARGPFGRVSPPGGRPSLPPRPDPRGFSAPSSHSRRVGPPSASPRSRPKTETKRPRYRGWPGASGGAAPGRPGGGWARGRARRGARKMEIPGTPPPFPGLGPFLVWGAIWGGHLPEEPEGSVSGGWTAGASAARLGGGGPEFTALGVPQEAFQPGDLAFPQISAPRARPSPPLFTLRKHSIHVFGVRPLEDGAGREVGRGEDRPEAWILGAGTWTVFVCLSESGVQNIRGVGSVCARTGWDGERTVPRRETKLGELQQPPTFIGWTWPAPWIPGM